MYRQGSEHRWERTAQAENMSDKPITTTKNCDSSAQFDRWAWSLLSSEAFVVAEVNMCICIESSDMYITHLRCLRGTWYTELY